VTVSSVSQDTEHVCLLQIFGDRPEFVDGSAMLAIQRTHGIVKAMVEMIVDQGLLGLGDSLLDGMQLLGDIKAGAASFNHLDNRAQMPVRALQPLDDIGMCVVHVGVAVIVGVWLGHDILISPQGDKVQPTEHPPVRILTASPHGDS
jgi:hypothetical protein